VIAYDVRARHGRAFGTLVFFSPYPLGGSEDKGYYFAFDVPQGAIVL